MQIVMEFRFFAARHVYGYVYINFFIQIWLMEKFSCVGNSSCEKSIKIRKNAHTRKVRRENEGPCKVNMLVASEILHFFIIA